MLVKVLNWTPATNPYPLAVTLVRVVPGTPYLTPTHPIEGSDGFPDGLLGGMLSGGNLGFLDYLRQVR